MNLTFKQFMALSQPVEQLTEQQLDEIFGSLFSKLADTLKQPSPEEIRKAKLAKLKELQAKREKLLQQRGKTRAEIDQAWKDAKAASMLGKQKMPASNIKMNATTPNRPSAAAIGRAAEREFYLGNS